MKPLALFLFLLIGISVSALLLFPFLSGFLNFLQLIDADGERQVVSVSDASLATLPRLMGDLESWDATRFLSPAMTSGSSDPGD